MGRRILFGRLHEGRYSYVQRASSWSGIFALPMVLSLSADGDLLVEPVPELEPRCEVSTRTFLTSN